MNSWKVHIKWTGVSHEKVIVKADTKEEAETLIKKKLESNEWSIFDHAWDNIEWENFEIDSLHVVGAWVETPNRHEGGIKSEVIEETKDE